MMARFYSYVIPVLGVCWLFLNACTDEPDYYSDYSNTIVVEGSIEINGFPKVFLTRNIPYYVQLDSSDLIHLVLRQAKVTVSDGEQSEILTLKYNKNEFPPFYYQGNQLMGEAGKTYYLTIDYGEKKLTANTTIPNPVMLDTAWFEADSPGDSLGKIRALLKDDGTLHSYYKTFTKIRSKQTQFYPTLISNFDDRFFNGMEYVFQLRKGAESYMDLKTTDYYYIKGDTVLIKIATIDEPVYQFWVGYQNEVANGANPFASSYHVIESNIKGGGKGIWAGYGSSLVQIVNK
jgi:hypothetical protein